MPAQMPTLPERLLEQGYATRYVGKWHLDKNNPRGWEYHSLGRSTSASEKGHYVMDGINAPHQGCATYPHEQHCDGCVLTESLEQLDQLQNSEKPWAMMSSFYGPHAPYYLPQKWYDLIDPQGVELPDDFDAPFENKPDIQSTFRCRAWGKTWTKQKWQKIRAAYWGYCAMLDDFIGKLLANVDMNNTAVLFLSDHGEMNGHQKMIYKGPMMYEQLVHVPMLLHIPGQSQARIDNRLCKTEDFTAALLRLAGDKQYALTLPTCNILNDTDPGRDAVTSEFHEANWVKPIISQRVAMLRDRLYKYILTEGQQCELYDMTVDLPEIENLAVKAEYQDRVKIMHDQLCSLIPWVKDVK
tara:strand:+ start:176 stop:1240 length:1065 start_codon:yes stop_codon:yes gene_type:complete